MGFVKKPCGDYYQQDSDNLFFSHFSHNFLISFQSYWGCPPIILHAQCQNLFFLFFPIFKHLPTLFKKKTGSSDAPFRLDARGRRTPCTSLCTPLCRRWIHAKNPC